MNRAVLYARVSTPQQAKLYSLTYQLEQERQYTTEAGLSVVAELDEDKSGRKTDNRDKLEEACRLLEENEADVLVVWKFDRLHRNYVNSVLLRDRIRRAGKELHYAQTRAISGKYGKIFEYHIKLQCLFEESFSMRGINFPHFPQRDTFLFFFIIFPKRKQA